MSLLSIVLLHLGLAAIQIATVWGLYVTYGLSGQLSLFQAAAFAVGAYAAALVLNVMPAIGLAGQVVFAPVAGLAAAAIVASVVGLVLSKNETDYVALLTLAMSELLRLTIGNWGALGGWNGMDLADAAGTGEGSRLLARFAMTVWLILLAGTLIAWTKRSRHGDAFVVNREQPALLPFLGLNPRIVRFRAFVLGSSIAGLAGGAYALLAFHVTPDLASIWKAIELLALAVLAGESLVAVVGVTTFVYLLKEALFFLDFQIPVPFGVTGRVPVQQVWPALVSVALVLVLALRGRRQWRLVR